MKKTIMLLILAFSLVCAGQTKKSKNKTTSTQIAPEPIITMPYEIGDNICNSFCYNFYKNSGWGGEEYGDILVKTVASVEKVANSKIQIKIISIKRERYGRNCQEIHTDKHIFNLKYGETELLENQTYWIDPTKNITWIKCD